MSAFKQFLASDIIVTPFEVNKSFVCYIQSDPDLAGYGVSIYGTGYYGEETIIITSSCDLGLDRFLGTNVDWYTDRSTTGIFTTEYQSLIYNSVKQLYYTNYLSSSTGDNVSQPVLFPGSDASGDVLIGRVESPLYDNYLQSTLTPNRFFPTESGVQIGVFSIPSKVYGDYIKPNSFKLEVNLTSSGGNFSLTDDGEGNLIDDNGLHQGNIIYTHGIAIITNSGSYTDAYGTSSYGLDSYGEGFPPTNVWMEQIVTCSFSSSYTIYETQYKCTLRESEFNATLNPSAQASGSTFTLSGSTFYKPGDGSLNSNVTGSYFSPYVTTVGLYDENQNLLAIGKLAQPLPTSATTDTTILVNIDK